MADGALLRTKRYALRVLSALRIVFLSIAFFWLGYQLGRSIPQAHPWTLEQLRALDPADQPEATADLMALFTRRSGAGCELRLDFVELPDPLTYDLQIQLGNRRLRLASDKALPAGVSLQADALTDTLTVSVSDCPVQAATPVRVATQVDSLGPVSFAGPAPTGRAALSLAFYDTFSPAATPVQALRRWDGAHTGPRGERHGLHDLLNAAQQYHIPLTLLDLETPAALSAIDYLGGTRQLQQMQADGLLDLPQVTGTGTGVFAAGLSQAVARAFGLRPGGRVYDVTHPPAGLLPADPAEDGLPLDIRRRLADLAGSGGAPLALGGDFQRTTWGTPDYAGPALAWLAARPYIIPSPYAWPRPAAARPTLPSDPLKRSALEAQAVLAAADPQLAANYRDVPAGLQAIAAWARQPVPQALCAAQCLLSNGKLEAVIDPRGGRLVFLFDGAQQLVGPTAQFFVGFSDRSEWDLSKGEGADPQQVMGAFADADDAFRPYSPDFLDGSTLRLSAGGGRVKTYRLTGSGLEVQLSGPVDTNIPLVVDPGARFAQGWAGAYSLQQQVGSLVWGLPRSTRLRVEAQPPAVLSAASILDARGLLFFPEDPDREYPAGIYLPFPLAMVRLTSPAAVMVEIGTVSAR